MIDLESDTLKRMKRRRARHGFEIIAFTFVKSPTEEHQKPEKYEEAVKKTRQWFMKQPNVVFASVGEGLGWDHIYVSLHKNYSEFAQLKRKHDTELSNLITNSQRFIADMNPKVILKPLNLKYLEDAK